MTTYMSVQQMVLESDPQKLQQLRSYLESKTTERLELLKKFQAIIKTDQQRELFTATGEALAPYMAVRREVERLSGDPKTKAEAAAMLRVQLEPLYTKLQEAIEAELSLHQKGADAAGARIQETVARAQTGLLISLLAGLALGLAAGYFLVQAINRPLARLVSAMELLRGGDFSQKIALVRDGEFSTLAEGLNLLTGALQEMAQKAEQVADGNLAIDVKRLSQADVMGNALAGMVEKLSSLIRRVQKSGLQVNTSATEIAATAQEQLSTASQVASTTSEIGATAREISTTSKELAHTIKEIAEVAEKTAALAGSGQSGLNRMKATMQQIIEASALSMHDSAH